MLLEKANWAIYEHKLSDNYKVHVKGVPAADIGTQERKLYVKHASFKKRKFSHVHPVCQRTRDVTAKQFVIDGETHVSLVSSCTSTGSSFVVYRHMYRIAVVSKHTRLDIAKGMNIQRRPMK